MMKCVTFMTLTLALATAVAQADVTEYGNDDRDQWFSDVGGVGNVSTVDFTGLPPFTPVTDQWSHLGVHFAPSFGALLIVGEDNIAFPDDGFGLRGEPDINITFSEPMNWIAADFPGTMIIELYEGNELLYQSEFFGIGGAGNFGGLISDTTFDGARIYDPFDGLVLLDDLHFGPPIPAPASLAPFAALLLVRRARRR